MAPIVWTFLFTFILFIILMIQLIMHFLPNHSFLTENKLYHSLSNNLNDSKPLFNLWPFH
uniref:ATP synthase F0 subunit 8 n=1 Tax=Stygobromus allegheniensis TaxID=1677011 RepID=A0A6C0X4X5_9CRUS|nr:ATP synthase F0 subunit 8 [Stygobromus allegheniensis]QIC54421.1 ATP synthase F0 subunit 8 [Stygobromus allegheniensis]